MLVFHHALRQGQDASQYNALEHHKHDEWADDTPG